MIFVTRFYIYPEGRVSVQAHVDAPEEKISR